MEVYLVGGAVRDEQLGLPVKERDWCVVGASPDELLSKGYRQVGQNFPVFLHPETHEEYALARTERKTSTGYHGFEFHSVLAVPEILLVMIGGINLGYRVIPKTLESANGSLPCWRCCSG